MGLFDNLYSDPNQAGLFGLAQGLLQAGGPQRVPMGFGGALGQGLQGGIQAAQAAQAFKQQQAIQALHQQLTTAQIGNYASEDSHRKALEAEAQRKAREQANDEQALKDAHQFAMGNQSTQPQAQTPNQATPVTSQDIPDPVPLPSVANMTASQENAAFDKPVQMRAPDEKVNDRTANPASDPGYHERMAQYLYSKGKFKLGDEAAKTALSIRKEIAAINQGKAPQTKDIAIDDKQQQTFQFNPKTGNFDIALGKPRPIFNPNPLIQQDFRQPVAVTDKDGNTKLVQFDQKGNAKETPYAPANSGLTAEAAGKVSMQKQAITDLETVESKLFKNGKLDKTLVAAINIPGVAGLPGYTDARNTYSAIRNAVAAKLRIETGAQANASEIDDIMKRFMPTLGDTDQSAREKIARLKQTFVDALAITKGLSKGGNPSASETDKSALKKKYGLE